MADEKFKDTSGSGSKQLEKDGSKSQELFKKLGKGIKLEDKIDYAVITEYLVRKIAVECGEKKGDVSFYSHEDHIHKDFMDIYESGLKKQIEKKKLILSEQAKRDVGSLVAIARYIEDGDYDKFLAIFDILLSMKISSELIGEGEYDHLLKVFDQPLTDDSCDQFFKNIQSLVSKRKLQSLEHVFRVYDCDSNKTYYIMPAKYGAKQAFKLIEERGAIAVAVYKEFKEKINETEDSCKDEINAAILGWISGENKKRSKMFADILEESMVKTLEGDMPTLEGEKKVYKNCIIFEDVLEKIKQSCIA
jgi:hypothetical protein